MEKKGWIKLPRHLMDSPDYFLNQDRRPNDLEKYIDLVYLANYQDKDKVFILNGKKIKFGHGEYPTATRYLARRWKYDSNGSIPPILKRLKDKHPIDYTNEQGIIVIKALDYSSEQDLVLEKMNRIKEEKVNAQVNTGINAGMNKTKEVKEVKEDIYIENPSKDEINDVISSFKGVNSSYKTLFKNKSQREAASNLLDRLGGEKLREIIEGLPEANTKEFFPVAHTPVELWYKLDKILNKLEGGQKEQQDKQQSSEWREQRIKEHQEMYGEGSMPLD